MGAADYAEDARREPPPELTLYFQMRDFPGSLPEAGGLRDQPAGLLTRIRRAGRVWTVYTDFHNATSWKRFSLQRPDDWELKNAMDEMRNKGGRRKAEGGNSDA
jgi:hypothetical protein